jgi:hypothetical protein
MWWVAEIGVTSLRYRDRTPSLAGGPHEITYDGSMKADLRFTSSE